MDKVNILKFLMIIPDPNIQKSESSSKKYH